MGMPKCKYCSRDAACECECGVLLCQVHIFHAPHGGHVIDRRLEQEKPRREKAKGPGQRALF